MNAWDSRRVCCVWSWRASLTTQYATMRVFQALTTAMTLIRITHVEGKRECSLLVNVRLVTKAGVRSCSLRLQAQAKQSSQASRTRRSILIPLTFGSIPTPWMARHCAHRLVVFPSEMYADNLRPWCPLSSTVRVPCSDDRDRLNLGAENAETLFYKIGCCGSLHNLRSSSWRNMYSVFPPA